MEATGCDLPVKETIKLSTCEYLTTNENQEARENSDSYYTFWYLSFHLCSPHNIQIYYTWKIKIPPRVEGTIIYGQNLI